jgi:hypothetical protein
LSKGKKKKSKKSKGKRRKSNKHSRHGVKIEFRVASRVGTRKKERKERKKAVQKQTTFNFLVISIQIFGEDQNGNGGTRRGTKRKLTSAHLSARSGTKSCNCVSAPHDACTVAGWPVGRVYLESTKKIKMKSQQLHKIT